MMMNADSMLSRAYPVIFRPKRGLTLPELMQPYIDAGSLPHWFRLRETSGTNVANSGSLTASVGTLSGTGYTLGQAGLNGAPNEAFAFAGTNGKITITHVAEFNVTTFTWAAFFSAVNGDAGGGNGRRIADKEDLQILNLRPNGSIEARVNRISGNSSLITAAATMTYPVSKCLFFMTFSEAAGVKIYRVLNGELITYANSTGLGLGAGAMSLTGNPFFIANHSANARAHNGVFDEFMRFSGVILTAEQMLAIGSALGA